MSYADDDELLEEALRDLPVFPLPGTVLLPRTFISLHVFEPRYRLMMEDCIEGYRLMAIAMLDEQGMPDQYQRPPIHPVAGIGALRRAAKLPDGRYNIVLEGIARADISGEHAPSKPYRCARARIMEEIPAVESSELAASIASLRSLCSRAVAQFHPSDSELFEGLNQVNDPSRLADMVAAAALEDNVERQRVLAEADVMKRINVVAGALGALLLTRGGDDEDATGGWGITPGKA